MRSRTSRSASAALAAVGLLAGATACSGGGSGDGADGDRYVFWDPYPQFDDDSDWVQLVERCGEEAGVTVDRSAFDTSDLTNRALLAAQQGDTPDIIVLDNPVVSTLAEAGVLTPAGDLGLDVSGISENLLAAGQLEGETYGVPIGANTLALYYNAEVLAAAGVDPASVTDWESLNAALEAVTAAGGKGITFSAIGTEEGSFQFLPWFWGADADLRELNSPEAVAAVSQWKDWLDAGWAPNSVINNTQTTSWQEFETGEYAFAVNGTWQLANADASGIDYGVIPIPAASGGAAAAPTGGEFVTAPVQSDTGRYEATVAITECLTSGENLLTTDTTLSYVAPTEALQDQQVAENEALAPWVEAVRSARGRTSDDLGTDYPVISEQLWTAVGNVLSGAQSPQDALDTAQEAAAADTAD
ncbi:sugar ABC transporter substrate-binding protein [Streptomyces litchfieldiae]|uniref:Extracellular solute-binding protein n=1 Tax=Streptomyces litchfieldiae TaxID=3075543 RepID=A0ABU2MQM7_9ACTN|nr:extracellular solute-binding protein [Streptomyces sp. DSM 44938]MDT0343916.1 extracellular solute-binding protein [Streptomyces sp. DSM 44938]